MVDSQKKLTRFKAQVGPAYELWKEAAEEDKPELAQEVYRQIQDALDLSESEQEFSTSIDPSYQAFIENALKTPDIV